MYVTQETGDATVMWVDRSGAITPILTHADTVAGLRLSPDGDRAVFHDEHGSLWTLDVERGSVDVLLRGESDAAEPYLASGPDWHPDGQRVTFAMSGENWRLYEIDVTTRGVPRPLLETRFPSNPGSWSADGRLLAYCEEHPVTGSDIWMDVEGGEPVPVVQTPNIEFSPVISPNAKSLAFVSDESGRFEVYVQTYPGGEVQKVSVNGGEEPVWSSDGTELFFRHGDQLLSSNVMVDHEIDVSAPRRVFEMPFDRNLSGDAWSGAYYDFSSSRDRFLVVWGPIGVWR